MSLEYDINNDVMEIVDIKVSRYQSLLRGALVSQGQQWILIEDNPVDYVLDGYSFINKKYVKHVSLCGHESITYKIISQKYQKRDFCKLDNYFELIDYLRNNNLLITIGLSKQESILVGHIKKINSVSFKFHPLSVTLEHLDVMDIRYDQIRFINVNSDYLSSISNYLTKTGEEQFNLL